MSRSDADTLEQLKLARDAIIAGMIDGRLTVEYQLAGEMHTVEPSTQALNRLEALINTYTRKANQDSKSPIRVASLSRAGLRGCG
ncbi:MAG TPA: hypothetical protein VG826_29175 [Pirellulales bacterium]|nr:hypothetical protein [Pirellulales bacterium]